MAPSMMMSLRNFCLYRSFRLNKTTTFLLSKRTYCKEKDSDQFSELNSVEDDASSIDASQPVASKQGRGKAKSSAILSDKISDIKSEKKEAASAKLLSLLSEMSDSNFSSSKPKVKLNLAKPLPSVKYQMKTDENFVKNRQIEKDLGTEVVLAVKEVAVTISGDPEKTKSELTMKLLSLARTREGSLESEKMTNVAEVVEGMKLEKAPTSPNTGTKPVRSNIRPKFDRREQSQTINLFDSPPLDIFHPKLPKMHETVQPTELRLWNVLQNKELKLMTYFAPRNAYEEMIRWTEEGKHWKLPMDNFSDIGPEENVGFHEHVFLEKHLHGFPTKGPIRHFMELVCVGLSKNPYITVERKIENIDWFRQYFMEKEQILKDYGVLDSS